MAGYSGNYKKYIPDDLEAIILKAKTKQPGQEIWDILTKDAPEIQQHLINGVPEREIIDNIGLSGVVTSAERQKIVEQESERIRHEYKPAGHTILEAAGITKPHDPYSQAPRDKLSEVVSPRPEGKKLDIWGDQYPEKRQEVLGDYLKKEHPIAGRVGSVLQAFTPTRGPFAQAAQKEFPWMNFAGQLAKYSTTANFLSGAGLPYGEKLAEALPNIGINPKTLARGIAESIEWGGTFAIPKFVENLSLVADGEKPSFDKLVLDPMAEGMIGTIIGPTTLIPEIGTRMLAKGTARVGAGLLAAAIKEGAITKDDVKKCLLYGALSSGVEWTKGHKKAIENSLLLELDRKLAPFTEGSGVSSESVGKELIESSIKFGKQPTIKIVTKEFTSNEKAPTLSIFNRGQNKVPMKEMETGVEIKIINPSKIKVDFGDAESHADKRFNLSLFKPAKVTVEEFSKGIKEGAPTEAIIDNITTDPGDYKAQLDKLDQKTRWNVAGRDIKQKSFYADQALDNPVGITKPTYPVTWAEPDSGEITTHDADMDNLEATTLRNVRYSEQEFRRNSNAYYGIKKPFGDASIAKRNTVNAWVNEGRKTFKDLKLTKQEAENVGAYREAIGELKRAKIKQASGAKFDINKAKEHAGILKTGLTDKEQKWNDYLQRRWDAGHKLAIDNGMDLNYEDGYFPSLKKFRANEYKQASGYGKMSGLKKQWWEYHKEGGMKNTEKDSLLIYEKWVNSFFKNYYFKEPLDNATKNVLDTLPTNMNKLSSRYMKRMMGWPSDEHFSHVAMIKSVFEAAGSYTPFLKDEALKKASDKITINTTMDTAQFLFDDVYAATMGPTLGSLESGFVKPLVTGVPQMGPTWITGGFKDLFTKGFDKNIGFQGVGKETLPNAYQELKTNSIPTKMGSLRNFASKGFSAGYNIGRQVIGYAANNKFKYYLGDLERDIKFNKDKAIDKFMHLTRTNVLNKRVVEQIRRNLKEGDYINARNIFVEENVGKTTFRFNKENSPLMTDNIVGKGVTQLSSMPNNYAELLTDWTVNKDYKALLTWVAMAGGVYELSKRKVLRPKENKYHRILTRSVGTGPIASGFRLTQMSSLEPIEKGLKIMLRDLNDPNYDAEKPKSKLKARFMDTFVPFRATYKEYKDLTK